MPPMSTYKIVSRRLADDWKLLLSILVGITVAATLVAAAPIYIRTLERQGIDTGVNLDALVDVSAWLEREVLLRPLPGRVYRARLGERMREVSRH